MTTTKDELPKLRRSLGPQTKVTIYFDREIETLYRLGKQNGWDVSEIIRRAASEALRQAEQTLRTRADV